MSDLGGGRTSNGGPVPVPSSGTPTGLKTPRDVMRDRRAREAKRQEEARLEEQRRQQQAEERRRSAERRATAASGEPRYSAASSNYTPDTSAAQGAFPGARLSSGAQVASGADYGVPTGRMSTGESGYVSAGGNRRATGTSQSQDQPRPAQTASASAAAPTTASRRAQPTQGAARQSSGSTSQPAGQSQQQQQRPPSQSTQAGADASQGGRASSFPHAFERWEQLSSHWEGLTSYWLRRLETDAEEIQRTVPSATAMSRQITDLSAAGANLFHAVVELQKLRASSERKFQRWFFETRADTERNSEIRAQLEQQLQAERNERQRTAKKQTENEIATENARQEAAEMRRELMISKEEARRAWEELGRRNQESLELAESLKAGRMTIVSGVQVMPIFGGPSRTASASQRPVTRDGQSQFDATPGVTTAGAAGLRSPGDEELEDDYYHQEGEGESPTDTDPFTESKPPLHHEPGIHSLATGAYQPYPTGSSGQGGYAQSGQRPVSSGQSGGQRSVQHQATSAASIPISDAEAHRYYQSSPHESYHRAPATSSQYQSGSTQTSGQIPTITHNDGDLQSESDGWAEEDAMRRERELIARYGVAGSALPVNLTQIPPEAPSAPATSAAAMATYTPATHSEADSATQTASADHPDYEGSGFSGWETLGTRHHHPTRLSDVQEEEEERSSRRTAE